MFKHSRFRDQASEIRKDSSNQGQAGPGQFLSLEMQFSRLSKESQGSWVFDAAVKILGCQHCDVEGLSRLNPI